MVKKARGLAKLGPAGGRLLALGYRPRAGLGRMELLVLIVMAICIFVCLPQFILDKQTDVKKQQTAYRFRKFGLAVSQYHETYRAFPAVKKPAGR